MLLLRVGMINAVPYMMKVATSNASNFSNKIMEFLKIASTVILDHRHIESDGIMHIDMYVCG